MEPNDPHPAPSPSNERRWVISLSVLVVLLLGVSVAGGAVAFTEVSELRQDRTDLRETVEDLRSTVEDLEERAARLDTVEAELEAARTDLVVAEEQQASAARLLGDAQSELDDLTEQLTDAYDVIAELSSAPPPPPPAPACVLPDDATIREDVRFVFNEMLGRNPSSNEMASTADLHRSNFQALCDDASVDPYARLVEHMRSEHAGEIDFRARGQQARENQQAMSCIMPDDGC